MALTQSSFSSSAPATSQRTTASLNLPPSQTFDVLPALHELLARIDHGSNSSTDIQDPTTGDVEDINALYPELQPLEPKELPTEVLQIKAKIRKATKVLEKLPDMERTVGEQNEEIEALEDRIKRQREMLAKLGQLAKAMQEMFG